MAQNTVEDQPYLLPPEEELERAIKDYLYISRNKNNTNLFREGYNYWPAEEKAWERLQNAIEKLDSKQQG